MITHLLYHAGYTQMWEYVPALIPNAYRTHPLNYKVSPPWHDIPDGSQVDSIENYPTEICR